MDAACKTIWAEVSTVKEKPLIIGSYDRPPSETWDFNTIHVLEGLLQKIKYSLRKHILLCGDFNQKEINCNTSTVNNNSEAEQRLIRLASEHDLTQTVKQPTRTTEESRRLIDLVFPNQLTMISGVTVIPGISDHDAIMACVHLKRKYTRHLPRKLFLYDNANYQGMNNDMSAFSSTFLKFAPDRNIVEHNWKHFKSAFHDSMNKHIPAKLRKPDLLCHG